jgi:hypothetical protein
VHLLPAAAQYEQFENGATIGAPSSIATAYVS